jgi:MFS superfamily sulfate permease-like transporter
VKCIRKVTESRDNGFRRPHESIDWRKQSVSVSVLSARITRLLSEETAQVDDSHPRCLCNGPPIVEIPALLRQWRSRLFNYLRLGALIAIKATQVVIATRNQMLRITRRVNGEVVFMVSGQLTAENVAEMETLIAAETKGRRIVLDCTDLRSVDGEAVKFLEKWEADSIKLKNCGLYIREWIRRERLERKPGKSPET